MAEMIAIMVYFPILSHLSRIHPLPGHVIMTHTGFLSTSHIEKGWDMKGNIMTESDIMTEKGTDRRGIGTGKEIQETEREAGKGIAKFGQYVTIENETIGEVIVSLSESERESLMNGHEIIMKGKSTCLSGKGKEITTGHLQRQSEYVALQCKCELTNTSH
jgi:hypothetical protein